MTFPSFRDAGAVPGPGPVPEATCGHLAGLIPWDYHLVMTNIAGWIIPTRNGGFNLMGKSSISIRAMAKPMANCECHNQRVSRTFLVSEKYPWPNDDRDLY